MSKGWTKERRIKQAENIRKTKPWKNSTGPISAKGKERVSYNALKHGGYSRAQKEIAIALKMNRCFVAYMHKWVKSSDNVRAMLAVQNKLKEKRDKSMV